MHKVYTYMFVYTLIKNTIHKKLEHNMSEEDDIVIFDITRRDWKYRGLLTAELDKSKFNKSNPYRKLSAMLWIDENNIWNAKIAIESKSGKKSTLETSFKENPNIDEEGVLNFICKIPVKNKVWTKNPDGSIEQMYNIISKKV